MASQKAASIVMNNSEALPFPPPHCSLSVCPSVCCLPTHYCYNVYCFLFSYTAFLNEERYILQDHHRAGEIYFQILNHTTDYHENLYGVILLEVAKTWCVLLSLNL